MFEIVLYQPEIPPNTGNIIRVGANTGCRVHLVQPLGFTLHDKHLRRAGLDYPARAVVELHESLAACRTFLGSRRWFAVSTRGSCRYDAPSYRAGDAFLFGPETRGLPPEVMSEIPAEQHIRLPMRPDSRSLNLANAVVTVVYEAWRQLGFEGGA